jgi:lipopolysaccharide transport system permease protein
MKQYTASYRCRASIIKSCLALAHQARKFRWQIWLATKKNIQNTYQQDVLGIFWAIVMPIVPMTVYMILAHIKVFKTVDDMPHIFYIAMGMLVWLLMTNTIHAMTISIKAEKAILTTSNFPVFPAMLSRLGEMLHDTTIRLLAVIFIIVWYQVDVHFVRSLMSLLGLLPAIIFAVALGMILGLLDVVIQDTRRIVTLMLRYGLFVSSVIFPFPEWGIPQMLNQFNPFNTYVNGVRDLLYHGQLDNPSLYFYTSLVGVILFLIAVRLVYSMDYKVRAYL